MSINTLAAVAVEHYFVIVRCIAIGREASFRRVILLLLVVWLNSLGWAFAPALGWNRYILEGFGTTCSFDYITRTPAYRSLVLSMFLGGFLLPLCLIVLCYAYIFVTVHQSIKLLSGRPTSSNLEARTGARQLCRRTELRIARTGLVAVVVVSISWLPYCVLTFIGQFGDMSLITPVSSAIPGIFAKMSTIYNPFIYSYSHPRFREKLRLMLLRFLPETTNSNFMNSNELAHEVRVIRLLPIGREGNADGSGLTMPVGRVETTAAVHQ